MGNSVLGAKLVCGFYDVTAPDIGFFFSSNILVLYTIGKLFLYQFQKALEICLQNELFLRYGRSKKCHKRFKFLKFQFSIIHCRLFHHVLLLTDSISSFELT